MRNRARLAYSLVVVALCAVVEWLNRQAVQREFLPALGQVDAQLKELGVGSEI